MDVPEDQARTLRHVGELLRDWRQRRHMTQLDLACASNVPARLLGALETGKTLPNRDVVLRLAERLDIPLRERNSLLVTAGHQPAFPVRDLDDPALAEVRTAIDLMLAGHEPNPALAIDRHWVVLASNQAMRGITAGVDPALLNPPVNWPRLALHPAGLAPRIANLRNWRAHLLARMRRQFAASGDAVLADLLEEFGDYPVPHAPDTAADPDSAGVAEPLGLVTVDGPLAFHSTSTVFNAAVDVTLAELSVEVFFPANQATFAVMRHRAERPAAAG